MARKINIKPGDTFGHWTVVGPSEKKNYFLCTCVCGAEKHIYMYNLISGRTKSCGCHGGTRRTRADQKKWSPLNPGDQYGHWTVLGAAKNNRMVTAMCTCGTVSAVQKWALSSGASISCGCRGRKNHRLMSTEKIIAAAATQPMKSNEFRNIQKSLGIDNGEMAFVLGISQKTVESYRSKSESTWSREIPQTVAVAMRLLKELRDLRIRLRRGVSKKHKPESKYWDLRVAINRKMQKN